MPRYFRRTFRRRRFPSRGGRYKRMGRFKRRLVGRSFGAANYRRGVRRLKYTDTGSCVVAGQEGFSTNWQPLSIVTSGALGASGYPFCNLLNHVMNDTSEQGALGRNIKMVYLMLEISIVPDIYNGSFTLPPTPNAKINLSNNRTSDYARIILFYDRQPNTSGAAPLITDLFQDVTESHTTVTDQLSHFNMSNLGRFLILKDWRIELPPWYTVGNGFQNPGSTPVPAYTPEFPGFKIKKFIKLKGLETVFRNDVRTVGTLADIQSGALHIGVVGSQSNGTGYTTNGYAMEYRARLRFMDCV